MQFGETIKYLREEQNFTQTEVARACKVSTQCISALEMGTRNPTGSTVVALAQFFGCSTDYLLGLETEWGAKQFNAATSAPAYTKTEQNIITDYRQLNPACQKLVQDTIKTLLASSRVAQSGNKNIS